MPIFGKKGTHYICSLQCGAGKDAHLKFELSHDYVENIEIHKLEPIICSTSKGVDPKQILEQAIEGAKQASKDFNKNYFIKSISYIPNDSPNYDLHKRIVWEVIKHIENNGQFKELD